MERWCGSLLPAIKSKVKPFVSLALRQLHLAQLNAIEARYDLGDSLLPLSSGYGSEVCYDECTLRANLDLAVMTTS